jgi:CBS domain containing-hemolysin-like protein
LLAATEGALAAEPSLGDAPPPAPFRGRPEAFRRALALARVTLLGLAAVGASGYTGWWTAGVPGAAAALVVTPLLVALLGDVLPRALGLWQAGAIGSRAVRLAAASLAVLAPLGVAAGLVDRALARLLGPRSHQAPTVGSAQREMLLGVLSLADTAASEVMTPRVDVIGVDRGLSRPEVVARVAAAEHSRVPVVEGDLDHVVGVLHAKDLLPGRFDPAVASEPWQALIRPAEFIPETKTIDAQLRDFQRGPPQLAIVVDEFGGTAGLLTLEDVLEEIVGEIQDEYDAGEEPEISTPFPGCFDVDGRVTLERLSETLGVPLGHEEVSTVGGLVYAALGHVPVVGETVELSGFRVVVERVDRRSIERVRFERQPVAATEERRG